MEEAQARRMERLAEMLVKDTAVVADQQHDGSAMAALGWSFDQSLHTYALRADAWHCHVVRLDSTWSASVGFGDYATAYLGFATAEAARAWCHRCLAEFGVSAPCGDSD